MKSYEITYEHIADTYSFDHPWNFFIEDAECNDEAIEKGKERYLKILQRGNTDYPPISEVKFNAKYRWWSEN